MKEDIALRLQKLRNDMETESLHAFIFPTSDPHNGEYTPARWKGREWITGFTGSAGIAVVTRHEAALWTDSRYFIAAKAQLEGTEWQLMKEGVAGTPTIIKWLGRKLALERSPQVGVDGNVMMTSEVEKLRAGLRQEGGITLRTNHDPLARIWKERPQLPLAKVVTHPLEYAGEATHDKLARIRQWLEGQHCCGIFVSALDDIAWTLNLRGYDVHCTPVFVAFLLITRDKATLFIDKAKLTDSVRQYLRGEGVAVSDYADVARSLSRYSEYNIAMDPDATCYTLFRAVRCRELLRLTSPIPAMKAVKNRIEREGFRRAMERDGVAMVRFLRWLHGAVAAGGQTELTVAQRLLEFRKEQDKFCDLSFDTISAYKEHGAIVHYEPTKESDKALETNGLLLIDSGAQYVDGTTDITRTVALGSVTDEERHVYTLVLKGHLQLEMCKFPEGAAGTQIDAIARLAMWREGMNYLHGTGHGVGSFLSVHEGPQQIRMEWKPAGLYPGMTVTDEPGLYVEDHFGVRTENTLLVVPYKTTAFGTFVGFEPLTLCPIDKTPIDRSMLTDEEIAALNDYHAMVRDRLLPLLNDEDDKTWLIDQTSPL